MFSSGVFILRAFIYSLVFSLAVFPDRNGPRQNERRDEMTVFSRMPRMAKIPLLRLSSVTKANPFFMDSLGVEFEISLPLRKIYPLDFFAVPKRVDKSSVLPEPSSPATPSISPDLSVKDASFGNESSPERFETLRSSSPGTELPRG